MVQYKQTRVVHVDAQRPDAAIIEEAASLLRAGELVIFPTETVYGLGTNALQTTAVEQIFAAKERPYSDPLIAHIADLASLEVLVTDFPDAARKLAHSFWPGPLTMVLPASARVPRLITAGLDSVAVRMPSHPVAQALIRAAALPIAAPSANRFMHISPTTAQHALADLMGRVALILDGGPCTVGVESTIVDLSGPTPTILRPGGVSLEALRVILPTIMSPEQRTITHNDNATQKAPGQMLTHYSPRVPAFLVEGTPEEMRNTMQAEVQRRQATGQRVGILIADEDVASFQGSGAHIYALGNAPEQAAARLYAGLRVLEDAEVEVILCRNFSEQGIGLALRDRLLKATGGKVLRLPLA
jgi:L-threonylcarbamoyladenylate synthase